MYMHRLARLNGDYEYLIGEYAKRCQRHDDYVLCSLESFSDFIIDNGGDPEEAFDVLDIHDEIELENRIKLMY